MVNQACIDVTRKGLRKMTRKQKVDLQKDLHEHNICFKSKLILNHKEKALLKSLKCYYKYNKMKKILSQFILQTFQEQNRHLWLEGLLAFQFITQCEPRSIGDADFCVEIYQAYFKELNHKLYLIDEHCDLRKAGTIMTYIQITCRNLIKKESKVFEKIHRVLDLKILKYQFNPAVKKILESPIVGYEDSPDVLKLKGEIPAVLQDEIDKIMTNDEYCITTVGKSTLKKL